MSWADDFLRQQQGAQNAQAAGPPQEFLPGFAASAISAVPELFGVQPSAEAQTFRAAHPYAGIASELVGGLVPYAGVGLLSETETGAKALGTAMEALPGIRSLSAVDNPILYSAAREAIRYSPVEIARLGVGLGTTDNWHDYGNLFADVGLSTLITGGFGGIGGLFRVGGKTVSEIAGVEGAPLGLKPTFEYRMSRTPDAAPAVEGQALPDVQNKLMKGVFTETPFGSMLPGQKDAYVQGLEGGNAETDMLMNQLFKPALGEKSSVQRVPMMDRAGNWNLSDGARTEMLAGLAAKTNGAVSTMEDVAENMVFPRLVTVNSSRAAGTVSKALEDSAMQWVGDGVMAGKESEGGLHVMAVRLKAPTVPETGVAASQTGKLFIHGGSAFEDINPAMYGAGEPGGIRPLGRGLYGYLVDGSNPEEIKNAVAAAKNYAEKYGRGDKTVHIFDAKIADARVSSNGPKIERFAGRAPTAEQQLVTDAYTHANSLPVGPERIAAFDRARQLQAQYPDPQADFRVEQLPGGLVEAAVHSPQRLTRLKAFPASTPADEIAAGVRQALSPAGPPKIGPGDQWMLFKTDRPQVFAPQAHKLAQSTVDAWAKFRNAWRPAGVNDFANQTIDTTVQAFTPQDFKEATTLPKATAVSRITSRVANKFTETVGLKDSSTIRSLVNTFHDVMAPTVVNERWNPLFARLFGTLRLAHRAGDEIVNKMVGGQVKVSGSMWTRKNLSHTEGLIPGAEPIQVAISRLSEEDRMNFRNIQNAQAPAEEMAKYTADGMISDNLRKAIELVQANDRHLWETQLSPAFLNANLEGKFNLLEGYTGPRLFQGDWRAAVTDEHGNLKWLASGTRRQALHEAGTIIEEGNKNGLKLKVAEPYMIGKDKPVDEIKNLHDLVELQMGKGADMQDVVERALRRMAIDQKGRKPTGNLPRAGAPKTLTEERSGVAGSPDRGVPTAQELITGIDNHYKQLMHFAATKVWENRFQQEAMLLSKNNPTLFADLVRKKNQMMGYEGNITRTLNQTLDKTVLGDMVGSKSATKIATATNGLFYDWNLAIMNPTFSILNVLQPIQTVLPHLSFILSLAKRNLTEEMERDMTMTLRYGGDGKPREVIGVMSPAKIMARALKYMGTPPPELAEHLGRMKTRGTLSAQLFEGFIGGQSRGLQTIGDAYRNAGGGAAGSWEAMKRIATFTAERSEEVSRGIAASSYYILGKDYLGLEGDRLLQFMEKGTHNSMYGYGVIDRSRMFTGPIGSMFGLFKNWQMHFIASMFQYARLGWDKGAWGPLIWQFGAAGALGGLGAMGPLKWVADSLAKWNTDSPNSYLWVQEHWHDSADEIYFGLPALFGASLQASATIPGSDVRNDITSLANFVFLERAKAAGKAVGAAWDYGTANGTDPLRDGNVRDQLMQAFAPRAVFRGFASAEGDYIKSMSTGYPQVRDVSPLSKVLYGMGLNQVEVERQQVAARELWANQQNQKSVIEQLGKSLADAQLNQDFDEMEAVNRRAAGFGVPLSSVYKSARTVLTREQRQDAMSKYRGDLAQRYKQAWAGD